MPVRVSSRAGLTRMYGIRRLPSDADWHEPVHRYANRSSIQGMVLRRNASSEDTVMPTIFKAARSHASTQRRSVRESHQSLTNWQQQDLSHFRYTTGHDLFDVHHHFARRKQDALPGGYDLFLQALASAPTPHVRLRAGADLLNLASYNYLGLSCRPEVIAAAHAALARYGLGAAGSPISAACCPSTTTLPRRSPGITAPKPPCSFPVGMPRMWAP